MPYAITNADGFEQPDIAILRTIYRPLPLTRATFLTRKRFFLAIVLKIGQAMALLFGFKLEYIYTLSRQSQSS